MPTERDNEEVRAALVRACDGDSSAVAALLPVMYDELRALAGSFFRGSGPEQTLQPTALVHEAFLKLAGSTSLALESRAHFFALAAQAMRQVLADHARRRRAAKRRGPEGMSEAVFLVGLRERGPESCVDLVALDTALAKLSDLDARQCQIVELRFLAGMTVEEVARYLDIGNRTVEREWRAAKAWLRRELRTGADE